jgi:hypothetical protein
VLGRSRDVRRSRFREVSRHRPRSLLSPFLALDLTDPEVPPGGGLVVHPPGLPAPFCTVVVEVGELGAGTGVVLGLSGEAGSVLCRWAPEHGQVVLEVAAGRGAPTEVGRAAVPLPRSARLALTVNENRVVVLAAAPGEELRPVLAVRDEVRAVLDLRDRAVLAALGHAYGLTGGEGRLARVQAGISGPAGVRDPQVVRRPDGTPVVRDGKLYLTVTSAGLGFFQQAHWTVWTLDLSDPGRFEQVGALFSARDGLVLGDHAGHLVVDEEAGRTIVLVSTWGDHDLQRGVHVRHATTTEDVLHGVHVLATERLALPTTASAWDPSLARVDGRWLVAFVECTAFEPRYTFHPALAVARGGDYDQQLAVVGVDAAREQTEGTLIQRVDGDWWVFASDGDARQYLVYDTELRLQGRVHAPYGSNIPHPVVVEAAGGRRAPRWLVTFDGTPWHEAELGYGTHGDLVVMSTGR